MEPAVVAVQDGSESDVSGFAILHLFVRRIALATANPPAAVGMLVFRLTKVRLFPIKLFDRNAVVEDAGIDHAPSEIVGTRRRPRLALRVAEVEDVIPREFHTIPA